MIVRLRRYAVGEISSSKVQTVCGGPTCLKVTSAVRSVAQAQMPTAIERKSNTIKAVAIGGKTIPSTRMFLIYRPALVITNATGTKFTRTNCGK